MQDLHGIDKRGEARRDESGRHEVATPETKAHVWLLSTDAGSDGCRTATPALFTVRAALRNKGSAYG
jgi:hypothetical protein